MTDLTNTYIETYGTNARVFLRIHGGDPDQIISDLESRCAEPNPLAVIPGLDLTLTVEDVHAALLREIERIFFGRLSRADVIAVARMLGDLGSISICSTIPELTYTAAQYIYHWESTHPDQPHIQLVDDRPF